MNLLWTRSNPIIDSTLVLIVLYGKIRPETADQSPTFKACHIRFSSPLAYLISFFDFTGRHRISKLLVFASYIGQLGLNDCHFEVLLTFNKTSASVGYYC